MDPPQSHKMDVFADGFFSSLSSRMIVNPNSDGFVPASHGSPDFPCRCRDYPHSRDFHSTTSRIRGKESEAYRLPEPECSVDTWFLESRTTEVRGEYRKHDQVEIQYWTDLHATKTKVLVAGVPFHVAKSPRTNRDLYCLILIPFCGVLGCHTLIINPLMRSKWLSATLHGKVIPRHPAKLIIQLCKPRELEARSIIVS